MKVKDIKKWTAILFEDRVILPKDLNLMSEQQRQIMMELEVEKIKGTRYQAV